MVATSQPHELSARSMTALGAVAAGVLLVMGVVWDPFHR